MLYRKLALLSICMPFLLLGSAGTATEQGTEGKKIQFETHFAQPTITDENLSIAINAVDKTAEKIVADNVLPGLAISIVHNDKVVYAKGFGLREVGKADKVDQDTVFQLASCSKPLASTVVAALVGEGKISWDSKISNLDSSFQMNDPWVTREITLRDMFSHRSGLPDHAGDVLEDLGYDREQILYRLRFQQPDSSFRSAYAYTNFGLTEAAVAAAKTNKLSWEETSEQKLYKPLAMKSTSSRYADFMGRQNKALGHVLLDGKWVQKYKRQPDAQSPAGGASSSVNDMAKWMMMQIAGGKYEGKEVVSSAALEETHHPQVKTQFSPLNGLPEFYGLGFNVSYDAAGRLRLSHSGAFSMGAATTVVMIPSEKLGICVLTNAYPIGVAEGIAAIFTDTALFGKTTQNWLPLFRSIFSDPATLGVTENSTYNKPQQSPVAAHSFDAYIGKYENEFYGELQIMKGDNGLSAVLGPRKMTFPLKHFDRDIFTYEIESEDLSGTSGLRFDVDSNGKAAQVLIENLNQNGQGSFKRVAAA
ncbi:MAG: serine hydrolase, partial [Candidatus Obscuribacterales bacterium]|nr:serine hydrolase [Candidatus Obscuribacterales bacterium]